MEDKMFYVFVIILSLVLLASVMIVMGEMIAHKKDNDNKRFRARLQYMRPFREGYAFSDDPDLSKAMQIMYITGDRIEFSDTGLDGKYHEIWSF